MDNISDGALRHVVADFGFDDNAAFNNIHDALTELRAYCNAAPLEKVQEWAKAEREGRLEIITQRQKEARDYLRDYSAEDRYFDDEYN